MCRKLYNLLIGLQNSLRGKPSCFLGVLGYRKAYDLLIYLQKVCTPTADTHLVHSFRESIASLQGTDENLISKTEETWSERRKRLQYLVMNRDPMRFLRWDVIVDSMFVGNANFVIKELETLRASNEWESRWGKGVKEDRVGLPLPFYEYWASSGNLIHHAYHIHEFEASTKSRVDDFDLIFEFGGGYGSMCRLIHRLGFRGNYVIFDLPEFSALQEFFLSNVGIPVKTKRDDKTKGITLISSIESISDQIKNTDAQKRLFLANWSLSESPTQLRESVLSLIEEFDAYLISYQASFCGVDNNDFFEKWYRARHGIEWHHWAIAHLPGNYYLIGLRNGGL